MWTARPAARPALSGRELFERSADSAAARRFLFRRDNPTNPFVPGQRRQALPGSPRRRGRADSLRQVRRNPVYGTGFALVLRHTGTLTRAMQRGNRAVGPAALDGGAATAKYFGAARSRARPVRGKGNAHLTSCQLLCATSFQPGERTAGNEKGGFPCPSQPLCENRSRRCS